MLAAPDGGVTSIYLARGDEVDLFRPLLTGDIFSDTEIPGVDTETGLAMVLDHPCSMRRGVILTGHLVMARVISRPDLPRPAKWPTDRLWDLFPLPELDSSAERRAAALDQIGRVPSASLDLSRRVACLSDQGIVLLIQRQIHRLSRFVAPLPDLYEVCAPVLTEADLLSEWNAALVPHRQKATGAAMAEAIAAETDQFEAFLASDEPSLRERLKTDHLRSVVRRATRLEIRERRTR